MIIYDNVFIQIRTVTSGDCMAKMNKEPLNVTVSRDAKTRAVEYGASGEFGNASNFVESALWYFIGAREARTELELEKCRKELQEIKEEAEHSREILLKILTKHPKLIEEVNNMSNK